MQELALSPDEHLNAASLFIKAPLPSEDRTVGNSILYSDNAGLTLPMSDLEKCVIAAQGSKLVQYGIEPLPTALVDLTLLKDAARRLLSSKGIGDNGLDYIDIAACKLPGFHTDLHGFSSSLFCVTWQSEDAGLDLYFPHLQERVPLTRGRTIIFDPVQPHGIVDRGSLVNESVDNSMRPIQVYVSVVIDMNALSEECLHKFGVVRVDRSAWQGQSVEWYVREGRVDPKTGTWHKA
jgi:hypothetical protein